jgi:hypothetical protein
MQPVLRHLTLLMAAVTVAGESQLVYFVDIGKGRTSTSVDRAALDWP